MLKPVVNNLLVFIYWLSWGVVSCYCGLLGLAGGAPILEMVYRRALTMTRVATVSRQELSVRPSPSLKLPLLETSE